MAQARRVLCPLMTGQGSCTGGWSDSRCTFKPAATVPLLQPNTPNFNPYPCCCPPPPPPAHRYFKSYNYSVKETGEVITFVGTYAADKGQAAAVTFYTFVGESAGDACSSLCPAALSLQCPVPDWLHPPERHTKDHHYRTRLGPPTCPAAFSSAQHRHQQQALHCQQPLPPPGRLLVHAGCKVTPVRLHIQLTLTCPPPPPLHPCRHGQRGPGAVHPGALGWQLVVRAHCAEPRRVVLLLPEGRAPGGVQDQDGEAWEGCVAGGGKLLLCGCRCVSVCVHRSGCMLFIAWRFVYH
jgi:hypothetical protein